LNAELEALRMVKEGLRLKQIASLLSIRGRSARKVKMAGENICPPPQ
jgi:DNA-binding CsgD family transcriptional regulator